MSAGTWWLLPGTLCTEAVFAPLLSALDIPHAQRRVVAIDRPRVGDYAAALAGVGPQDVVVGFSLGAMVAAHHLDAMSPRATVLVCANPFADDPARREGREALADRVRAQGGAAVVAEGMADLVGPHAGPAHAMAATVIAMAAQTEGLIGAQTTLALERPGAEAALRHARSPVLFCSAAQDRHAPASLARQAARLGPHRIEVLTGGHFLPLEAPSAMAQVIRDFLDTNRSAPC